MIKKHIPNKIKDTIKSFFIDHNINYYDCRSSVRGKIYVALAADYGNLGDVAITYSQVKFIRERFPDYQVVDIPISRNTRNLREIKKNIGAHDIITIVGGGNLTNMYQDIEDCRLEWVKNFPSNPIICFPQTFDFSDDLAGKTSWMKSKEIYESHENLHFFLREKISYENVKEKLNSNIYLSPDIVLSNRPNQENRIRKGILSCIRDDLESKLSADFRKDLIKAMVTNFDERLTLTDTHIGRKNLSLQERTDELMNIWDQFSNSKVVITDRLHGMIFSAITNTPCVVLLNNNHKIEQTYKNWLSENKSITLVKDPKIESLISLIERKELTAENDLRKNDLSSQFSCLEETITRLIDSSKKN